MSRTLILWPGVALLLAGAAIGVFLHLSGRSPAPTGPKVVVREDPQNWSAETGDFVRAADFTLVFGRGSGQFGFDVLRVTGDGHCVYTFDARRRGTPCGENDRWKQVRFDVPPDVMDRLRDRLVNLQPWRMKASYAIEGMVDGTQVFLRMESSGNVKRIWCDNHVPHGVHRVEMVLTDLLLAPNEEPMSRAKPVNFKTFWDETLWSER